MGKDQAVQYAEFDTTLSYIHSKLIVHSSKGLGRYALCNAALLNKVLRNAVYTS